MKDADPDGEVVADLVGEYIFSDTDFVNSLSTGNRDLFDKIFDEVRYLCKVVTAGSKEARQLEKVKKVFEEAYRAETKNPTGDGGVKYALAKIEDVTPSREQREQNIQEVSQMEPVYAVDKGKLIPGEKSIKDIYREFFTQWGENIHSDVFGDIAVKNSSIRSEMRHGSTPVKVASIEAIPSVIHNGKIVEWIEKDSGLMRIVVAAPIKIGETPYFMGVMLQRDTQNQRLYLHDVVIEKEASNPSQEHLDSTGPAEGSGNLYTSNILDKIVKVKSQFSLSDTNSMPSGKGTLGKDVMYAPTAGDSPVAPIAENAASNAENVLPNATVAEKATVESAYEGIPIRADIAPPAKKATAPLEDIGPVRADISQTAGQGRGAPRLKERSWAETATGSNAVGQAIRPENLDQDKIHYQPISNKVTLDNANAFLDRQGYPLHKGAFGTAQI